MFKVEEFSIRLIEALQPVLVRVRARDRALADQLARAASSIALNIGEANYSDPGNRRARLFTAAGSASETRSVLRVAIASHHCTVEEAERSRELLENIVPILWKLTH